jgi:hypothetical protein
LVINKCWFGVPFSPKKRHQNGTCRTFFCETGKTAIPRSLYLLGVASFGAVAVVDNIALFSSGHAEIDAGGFSA